MSIEWIESFGSEDDDSEVFDWIKWSLFFIWNPNLSEMGEILDYQSGRELTPEFLAMGIAHAYTWGDFPGMVLTMDPQSVLHTHILLMLSGMNDAYQVAFDEHALALANNDPVSEATPRLGHSPRNLCESILASITPVFEELCNCDAFIHLLGDCLLTSISKMRDGGIRNPYGQVYYVEGGFQ